MKRFLLASVMLLALFAPAPPTPASCARELGISWSAEEGSTEQLDAFQLCLAR